VFLASLLLSRGYPIYSYRIESARPNNTLLQVDETSGKMTRMGFTSGRVAEALKLKRFHRLSQSGRLAELREGTGLRQADLARAIGVHPSQVSRWESGKGRPRPRNALALLELLDDGY
jgi:DNA-binding transcriptional regulator YiaG